MKRTYNYFLISSGVALFIYVFSLFWVPFMKGFIEQTPNVWFFPNMPVQLLVVIVPTIIAVCKFKQKECLLSILILYLLYFLFPIEGCHLIMVVQPEKPMVMFSGIPSWQSALVIVIQYGLIMLITTLLTAMTIHVIHWFEHRKKSNENQFQNDGDAISISSHDGTTN